MGTGGPFALKTLTTCQPEGWRQVCLTNLRYTPNLIKVVSIILFTIKSYAHWKPNKALLNEFESETQVIKIVIEPLKFKPSVY